MTASLSPAKTSERPVAIGVRIAVSRFWVALADGRMLGVPYSRFPLLARASAPDRRNVILAEDGQSIHWPSLDEDIGVELLLYYTPSSR